MSVVDVARVSTNQIWLYDDHVDKKKLEEDDYCIRGERPVLVLQLSGMRALCLPISSSLTIRDKCRKLDCAIQFPGRPEPSVVIVDNVITVNANELKTYMGTLKEHSVERIKKIFMDYVQGYIDYDSVQKCYVNKNRTYKQEIRTESTQEAILPIKKQKDDKPNTDNISEESTKGNTKYTSEQIEFMLTHSVKESIDKFGLDASKIYSIRYKYRDKIK